MAPTFSPGYVGPGFYVKQQDISTPNVPQGLRIPAIIGQGSKTLVRQQVITRLAGANPNAQEGPLLGNQAIDIISVVDENNVPYTKGVDYLATRVAQTPPATGTDLVVDWSPKASYTGSADITLVDYTQSPNVFDGTILNLIIDGVTIPQINLVQPSDANDVITQINAGIGAAFNSYLVASLDLNGKVVLQANKIVIKVGSANTPLGFNIPVGSSSIERSVKKPTASVNKPSISYVVTYTSDKTLAEYAPRLFSGMKDIIAYYGAINPVTGKYIYSPTVIDSGTTTSTTSTTLTDSTKNWVVNSVVGNYVKISGGMAGTGQVRVILSNTSDTLTLSQPWTAGSEPGGGETYTITDINENSIVLGSQMAVDTNAAFIIGSQYADDLFNDENIKLAIKNLEESVSGSNPDCLVLMRGLSPSDIAPFAYLKNHCEEMSNQINNKFRVAIIGLASGNENFLDFANLAAGTHSRRIALVNISSVNRDFGDGRLLPLDGSYVAAAVAGVYCDQFVDAGEPMTRKSVANAFDLNTFVDPFITTEKNFMATDGVLIIERAGNDIRIRHALTTDNTSIFTQELKLTRSADFVSKYLRSNLENILTGQRFVVSAGSSGVIQLAKVNFTVLLENLKNPAAQIITSYDNLSVTQDATEKRQLNLTANIFLTTDVLWEYALLGFTV